MKPKSHKEFKKGIADEVGVHQSVVDDFLSFYYAKLRGKWGSSKLTTANVDGLGTFYLRKTKLEKSIKRGKSIIGNLAKRTYSGFAKSEDIQKDIVQMEKALEQMEKDILTKKEFRNNNV